MYRFKLI
jgi:hypothetical protein